MRPNTDDEPRYVISIAARILGIRTYTLRYYEKIGIIEPSRSKSRIRLYSDKDLTHLKQVKTLTQDLGINLAGVEIILRMSQRLNEAQHLIEELRSEIKRLQSKES